MELDEAISQQLAAGEMDTSNDGLLAAALGDEEGEDDEEEGEGEGEDENGEGDDDDPAYSEGEEKTSKKEKTSSASSSSSSASSASSSSSSASPSAAESKTTKNPQTFTNNNPLVPGASDKAPRKVCLFVAGSLDMILNVYC